MTIVWMGLLGWMLCGISAGALVAAAMRRPADDADRRLSDVDDEITEREHSSRRQDGRRAL